MFNMTPRPPDHRPGGLTSWLLAFWLLASIPSVSAQQQHDRLFEQLSRQNEDVSRDLVPFAPDVRDTDRASVRAAARSASGISSRLPARSLQDWKIEDFVLLATVDGMIHARDRNTGVKLWTLEADAAMVETIYYPRNKSVDGRGAPTNDFLWIVEPSKDGDLYGITPGSSMPMQKLGFTVKQLVEESPQSSEDPPVVYTGRKDNKLYTIDVASGKVLGAFAPTEAFKYEQGTCRQLGELDALDDDKCGSTGTLTLTRTEYIVGIQSLVTGEQISTIKFSEWGPNKRDRDLFDQYSSLKDSRYIHTRYNGGILALNSKGADNGPSHEPIFQQKFDSPVAQVFDVARPIQSTSLDTPLVLLPQPVNPYFETQNTNVFVNCTQNGSWYALSENFYPLVTRGAREAQCRSEDWSFGTQQESYESTLREALVGVHALSIDADTVVPVIGIGRGPPTLDGHLNKTPGKIETRITAPETLAVRSPQMLVVFVCAVIASLFLFRGKLPKYRPNQFLQRHASAELLGSRIPKLAEDVPVVDADVKPEAKVKFEDLEDQGDHSDGSDDDASPQKAKKRMRGKRGGRRGRGSKSGESPEAEDKLELDDEARNTEPLPTLAREGSANSDVADVPKPKKKAHRGYRGGKNTRERQALKDLEAIDGTVEIKPDIVFKKPSGVVPGLNNLVLTKEVLGQGSGGTIVVKGTFEGRDVAVKKMLGHYSELASQEVALLKQAEDHPNVIRYFCERQDDNFLYIALELCQSSLHDLFHDGHLDDIPENIRQLSQEVRLRPDKALKQLAEGLKHLHDFRIVHRDIKPQNMLVAFPKRNSTSSYPRFVISDFGLCKNLPTNTSTLMGATTGAGTTGWRAPELISQPKDLVNGVTVSTGKDSLNGDSAQGIKRAIDIFSLGCVFFYVLTNGRHPFDDPEGWASMRERNIKANRCRIEELDKHVPDDIIGDARDLISWMLQQLPEDRPTITQVLGHPFFWSKGDRLEFLSLASDRFDLEARDGTSEALARLESRAIEIIGPGPKTILVSGGAWDLTAWNSGGLPGEPNFLSKLDQKFIDTLGKQRKYQGHKLVDLLRALRNKHHHWDDMPDDVKRKVGSLPEGYLHYWEERFPGLVVCVWRVAISIGMSEDRRFARWFAQNAI